MAYFSRVMGELIHDVIGGILQNEAGRGESVTSAEFDRFLSKRVREAERMPSISSHPATGQTSTATTGQAPPDGELFSL